MGKLIRESIRHKGYILERVTVSVAGCWEWQNSVNPRTGYGQIGYYPYTAHRLAFILWKGLPVAELLRHSCHNKLQSGAPE